MSDITLTVEADIAVITINRPQARNAVNLAVAQGMASALDEAEQNSDVRVGIITGAGGHFCAGMDLKAFLAGENVRIPGRGFAGITQTRLQKPWIAAVEGYALGGGFEIALCCDLIVAAATAKFGLPEVKRGLVANAGGLLRLPRQMPQRIASELILSGTVIGPESLKAYGLINQIAESGQALSMAVELAQTIAANAPLALLASKRVIRESVDWSSDELFDRQNPITEKVFGSEDAKEGAKAFAEKRLPQWSGK